MIDFSRITSISTKDSKRLERSFFHSSKKQKYRGPKKKIILFFVSSLITVILLVTIFLINFNILILPQYKKYFGKKSLNLLDKSTLAYLRFLEPDINFKIDKSFIYLDVPFNKKNGVSLNFKDKMDLSNSKIILVVKKPQNDFRIYTILRDVNFFSNFHKPIEVQVKKTDLKSTYLEIPIEIEDNLAYNLNLLYINQIRFYFFQKKNESLSLLVKNIILQKRR